MADLIAELEGVVDLWDDTEKAYAFLRTHHAEIAAAVRDASLLRSLAAAMYQAAGAYDMPVRFLDVLAAAGNGETITVEQVDALLPCETPEFVRDKERLDWLESEANKPGGLLLHDGSESGRRGLGLRPGYADRTLREAVDTAMRAGEGEG
jgi:hypothetical protein